MENKQRQWLNLNLDTCTFLHTRVVNIDDLQTCINMCVFMFYIDVLRHFQQYFSYFAAVSFIGGGNRNTRENHRPVT